MGQAVKQVTPAPFGIHDQRFVSKQFQVSASDQTIASVIAGSTADQHPFELIDFVFGLNDVGNTQPCQFHQLIH